MLGSRSTCPAHDQVHIDRGEWELSNVDADRAVSKNLAKELPEKGEPLVNAWFEEAGRNLVLPIYDRSALVQPTLQRPSDNRPARERFIYYLWMAPVPEGISAIIGAASERPRLKVVQSPTMET